MAAAKNNIKTSDVADTYLDLINDDTDIKDYNYGGGTEDINPLQFKSSSKNKVGEAKTKKQSVGKGKK